MSEREITCAIATYLKLKGLTSTHVANERNCSVRRGASLKRQGLRAGTPDFIVFSPGLKYSLLLLEVKVLKGRLSHAQIAFRDEIREKCPAIKWAVAYGLDEAIKIIEEYLNG